jgi:TRAP transporter TAXI family solute receptor
MSKAQGMTWLAGPAGGGWYAMAEALAGLIDREHPGLGLKVAPGGGRDNPAHIQDGAGQIAMSIDFLVAAAYAGKSPYEGRPMTAINTLGTGWSPLLFHFLRGRDSTDDFRAAVTGRSLRIAIPAKDTSDELTFQRVLAFYGTSYERVARDGGRVVHGTYDEIVAALKDGEADYLFGATTKPAAIIAEAGAGARPLRLASMPADLMEHLTRSYGYGRGIIPAGTYPTLQSADVRTTFMETIFMISAAVPEESAHRITRTLLTHRAELVAISASMAEFDPRQAWRSPPAPLHPGALRAYRELGYAD